MSNNDERWQMYVTYYLTLLGYCECAFDGDTFTWTYDGYMTEDFNDEWL